MIQSRTPHSTSKDNYTTLRTPEGVRSRIIEGVDEEIRLKQSSEHYPLAHTSPRIQIPENPDDKLGKKVKLQLF